MLKIIGSNFFLFLARWFLMVLSKEILTLSSLFHMQLHHARLQTSCNFFIFLFFCFVIVFAKILTLFILQLYNISPFKKKYFQLSRNLLWVTKYILMIIITLICVGKTLLFSNYQMGFVGALKMYYTTSKNLQGIFNQ